MPGDLVTSPAGPVSVTVVYADSFLKSWVSLNGEPAFVTATHSVFTTLGVKLAGALVPGDELHLEDGATLVLHSVDITVKAEPNVNIETLGHVPYYVEGIQFGSYPSYPAAKAPSQ